LRGEHGGYLTEKRDKYVWLKWMELRVHGDLDAIETPTGYIPVYEDLRNLFEKYLNKEFKEDLYEKLFSIRISKLLKKYERAWNIYTTKVPDTPKKFYYIMIEQKRKLEEAESLFGAIVSPFKLDRR
jgi:phosphoenolpyruvate carboxykinase (GTP)